jgi:RsiW-degrading membrane proteinase PrsW (M82 family)
VSGPAGLAGHPYAFTVAAAGGLLGIAAAAFQELQHGDLLLVFIGAPIIEEILKPIGVYYLLGRRPWLLRNRLYTACLAATAGLVFAIIESLMYVHVYFRDHSDAYTLFRFSVTPAVHMAASFVVGLGISRNLLLGLRGELPFFHGGALFYVGGIGLHALYNTVVFSLSAAGILEIR